jgi:DNA polymerase-3 subunit delta
MSPTRKGQSKGSAYRQIETALSKRQFEPLYFVYGEEEYLKLEMQRQIIASALSETERDFNLDIVYGAEAEASQVLALCNGFPMMAERRVVIVRDFEKLKQNELFVSYAEKPNPSAVVVLVCRSKPNLSTNPYRAIKAKARTVEINALKDNELVGWIGAEIRRRGVDTDPRAAQMIGEMVGTDLQTIVAEIDKLTTFAATRNRVEVEDVIIASGQTRETNVFGLRKAVESRQFAEAARIAEQLLRQAASPIGEGIKIVSILAGFFTKLWIVTDCQKKGLSRQEMAQRIGVSPYFIQDYQGSLRYYDSEAIERAFTILMSADFELKGGSTRDPGLIVNLMLRQLMPAGSISSSRAHAVA